MEVVERKQGGGGEAMWRHAAAGSVVGVDRISNLPDGVLQHVLSFIPAVDAVRSSVLARRWRDAWTYAPTLNLDLPDEPHQGKFLRFAGAVLARYGAPDIPSIDVTIGCRSKLSPAAAAWLDNAMERVVGSIRVTVTAPDGLDAFVFPRNLRAKAISLRLSGHIIKNGVLVVPQPGEPATFARLMELSLSKLRLQEGSCPLGEFLSSRFLQLRKLRLSSLSRGPNMWPLVLHMDMLEELEVDAIQTLSRLEVVATSLRSLAVRKCFGRLPQWGNNTVVKVLAPRLEEINWSGVTSNELIFSSDIRSVRRLSGLLFHLPGIRHLSTGSERLLEMFSGADQLDVSIDIVDGTNCKQRYLDEKDLMEYIELIPNVRILSLRIVGILRFIHCPIAPIISAFLRQCPNLTLLHIDLSMLHHFSRLHPRYVVLPVPVEDYNATKQDRGCHTCEAPMDQLQFSSLGEIRINGFMGTDREMVLADLLFGDSASRPGLRRITISSFAELTGGIDGIAMKMKARFPIMGGCWETCKRKLVLTWTRTRTRTDC